MKSVKMFLMCVGLLAFTGVALGTVTTFTDVTGLAGWTQTSGVVPGSFSDDAGIPLWPDGVALTAHTGFSAYELLTDAMELVESPAAGYVAGWQTGDGGTLDTIITEGSYIAVRYDAPAGEVITDVAIPAVVYFDNYVATTVQIVDAAGNIVASGNASATEILVAPMSAGGLNTSSIEIRLTSTSGGQWGARFWPGNYILLSEVAVTTIPEPATIGLLGLGILGLLRRKRA